MLLQLGLTSEGLQEDTAPQPEEDPPRAEGAPAPSTAEEPPEASDGICLPVAGIDITPHMRRLLQRLAQRDTVPRATLQDVARQRGAAPIMVAAFLEGPDHPAVEPIPQPGA